ncbi:MFS transporter [Microbacterium fluvii]|uniref:MFS transporter n=1 Tax=Microbacterium fluvii TaxID=415215 RepID=A0ABW2HJ72_9MICO|nr:MFS transporter [Microbacterium fluvii]MCU4673333.1 MFS transporter [Microbacterium fluvii]
MDNLVPTVTVATARARLNLRAAMLVALAVFAQESVWNFYDAQVPASIAQYTSSAALIGLLMGVDNALGIVLQPLVGHLSDRTRTRFGRRVPYMVVGAIIAAVFFMLIPFAGSFGALIACIFAFAIVANSFKAVTESLTPDFQVPGRRSLANGIAKIATSLTIIVSALISLLVVDESLELAFAIPAVMMVCAMLIVGFTLHETRSPGYQRAVAQRGGEGEPEWTFRRVVGELVRDADRSRVFLLLAIFATAGSWAALRSQLTPYAMEVLDLSRGEAGSLTLPAGLAFIVVALPIAFLSDRIGRRLMVRIGLVVFIAGALVAFSVPNLPVTITGVIIASVGYAAFSINGIVLMWNLAPSAAVAGAYTGMYALASALGASLGPALIGLMVDATSWRLLFLHAAILAVVALVLFLLVRSENHPAQTAEAAQDAATAALAAEAKGAVA